MNSILEVQDLAVRYGGINALDGVSLRVAPGKLHGLIGPNGSGKSTFLAAVSKLTHVSAGQITFNGTVCTARRAHEVAAMGLARTFQTVRLLHGVSVLDNVKMGADQLGQARSVFANWSLPFRGRSQERRVTEIAMHALDRVGLADSASLYPETLAYGTQRRVEIARALASGPTLLLLDEPTAGMNRAERDEVSALVMSLRSDGLSQILVEHDLGMIHETCDHVWAFNFGHLIAEGSAKEVVENDAVRTAYIGRSTDESRGSPA